MQSRAFGLQIPLNEMGAFDLWAWQSVCGRACIGPKATFVSTGEADDDPGSDSRSFFPDAALRASRRGSHIREVRLVARGRGRSAAAWRYGLL